MHAGRKKPWVGISPKKRGDKEETPQGLQGVITVEMSYILPMILFVFALLMYAVFYFHDKNILIGAAAETAVLGAQMERKPGEEQETDMMGFYQQRIKGKLILFSEMSADIQITDKKVMVSASAERGRMSLTVRQQAPVLKPEKKIRRKRILSNVVESNGETEN